MIPTRSFFQEEIDLPRIIQNSSRFFKEILSLHITREIVFYFQLIFYLPSTSFQLFILLNIRNFVKIDRMIPSRSLSLETCVRISWSNSPSKEISQGSYKILVDFSGDSFPSYNWRDGILFSTYFLSHKYILPTIHTFGRSRSNNSSGRDLF